MSDASWFRKSSLASAIFTPIPEGQLFHRASPWLFGPVKEYRLTNAQADQLVKDFGRAQMRCVFGMMGALFATVLIAVIATTATGVDPDVTQTHPFIYGGMLLALTLVLMILARMVFERIYCASLKDLPYTLAPRPRQELGKGMKAIVAVQAMAPKWLHVTLLCVFILNLVQAVFAQKVLDVAFSGFLAVTLGAGLLIRLRTPAQES